MLIHIIYIYIHIYIYVTFTHDMDNTIDLEPDAHHRDTWPITYNFQVSSVYTYPSSCSRTFTDVLLRSLDDSRRRLGYLLMTVFDTVLPR